MKKKLFLIMASISFFIFSRILCRADTGTYTIQDYKVKLTPRSDGSVEIDYYQKWLVTSGSIPWITVGTPNSNFQIEQNKNKGAVSNIRSDNYGSWSGVRIDLNRDYRPNETFEIWFSIIQNRLFYSSGGDYKLDFTPGWYDSAATQHLSIEVFFFAKVETVTAKPAPSKKEGQSMFWEKSNLGRGEKFNISVSFPKTFFPAIQSLREPDKEFPWLIVFVIIFFIVIVVLAFRSVLNQDDMHDTSPRYGRGGRIFYGGSSRPKGGSSGLGGIFSGGGGGFGGRSFSCVCACACAGCACACACAGGGGAGCERKINHKCPLCKKCKNKDNCPIWKAAKV